MLNRESDNAKVIKVDLKFQVSRSTVFGVARKARNCSYVSCLKKEISFVSVQKDTFLFIYLFSVIEKIRFYLKLLE